MKKKLLIAGSAIAGLLIVSFLGLALFLDANQFRPQLEQAMGAALGRTVERVIAAASARTPVCLISPVGSPVSDTAPKRARTR